MIEEKMIFDEMTDLENEDSNPLFFENELKAEELSVLYSAIYQINKYQSLLG